MEAMGHGLTVEAVPSGGIPEMIVHGESGFLVNDEPEFILTVKRLQGESGLLGEIGRGARERRT
jgi:glycosyltransferase involved in cell wall biosynthesis